MSNSATADYESLSKFKHLEQVKHSSIGRVVPALTKEKKFHATEENAVMKELRSSYSDCQLEFKELPKSFETTIMINRDSKCSCSFATPE